MRKIRTLTLLSALLSFTAHATVWYVRAGASGSNNGTSWTNAFTTIQAGIGATTAGDTVWVANGTYKPTTTTSRLATFTLPSGVVLLGGFAGTETALSQRNYSTWQTILSGDIGQTGIHTDNSYNVVTVSAASSNTRLDGFKILYGRADGSSSPYSTGGGLYCTNGSPTITNCYFTENYASEGGAIRQANSGTVNILNCIFSNNTASGYGGAISVGSTFASGTVNIRSCSFSANQAGDGGGCYFYTGVVTVDQCVFFGNTASIYAGAIYEDDPTLTVSNTLMAGNTAPNFAIHYQDMGNPYPTSFINCTVAHNRNTSASPGNSFLMHLQPTNTVRNSIIWGNQTQSLSIYTPTVSNTVLQGGYFMAGTGIDTLDPQFILPGLAAAAPFTATGYDYRLKALSHAIDTGNSGFLPPLATLDLAGNTRVGGSQVDLGAYESSYCTYSTTILPGGNAVICPGNTLTLSVAGATSRLWSTGATSASITVSAPGNYNVAVVNSAGCRAFLRKTVTASAASVQVFGNPTICPGDTNLLTTGGTNASWLWNTGATTGSISVTAPGTYRVTAVSTDGCTVSDSLIVTAGAVPQPVITNNGGILQTGTFTTYQWQLNGVDIAGASGQSYTPTVNGSYTVIVTNAGGCRGASPALVITNLGISEMTTTGIRLFPNPATDAVYIALSTGAATSLRLTLCNQLGQALQQWQAADIQPGKPVRLPLNLCPAGIYFLRITRDGHTSMHPLRISGPQ